MLAKAPVVAFVVRFEPEEIIDISLHGRIDMAQGIGVLFFPFQRCLESARVERRSYVVSGMLR